MVKGLACSQLTFWSYGARDRGRAGNRVSDCVSACGCRGECRGQRFGYRCRGRGGSVSWTQCAGGWWGCYFAGVSTKTLVDAAIERYGGIDIIVNNAGYTWDTVIQKTTDEQFQAMLDIHLTAPFRILRAASGFIRAAAKAEIAEGRTVMRKVVNITSIAGTDGNAGQAGYSSGKAGIIGMTKTMAKEWGRYNVNVNAVGFGLIETRLIQPISGEGASIDIKGRPSQ